jgi:hypothetical protein
MVNVESTTEDERFYPVAPRVAIMLRRLVLLLFALASAPAFAAEVVVYKDANCGCCKKWISHLEANGFTVKAHDIKDLVARKTAQGVPPTLYSCHTAKVNGYTIEGHVPAADIRRLLKERPKVRGLAVPGMPVGSPGMEQGGHKDRYDVLTFDKQGKTGVYARY